MEHLCKDSGNGKSAQGQDVQNFSQSNLFRVNRQSVSTTGEEIEIKYDPGTPKSWSPRMIDAPRFERPSLTPEQAQAIKEYHTDNVDLTRYQWENGRAGGTTYASSLRTRPELGYTCTIEGGSPKLSP